MTIFNWIAKNKQEQYALRLEKRLLRANVKIVHLLERLARSEMIVRHQELAINRLIEHLEESNTVDYTTEGNIIYLKLKPKRKPKK